LTPPPADARPRAALHWDCLQRGHQRHAMGRGCAQRQRPLSRARRAVAWRHRGAKALRSVSMTCAMCWLMQRASGLAAALLRSAVPGGPSQNSAHCFRSGPISRLRRLTSTVLLWRWALRAVSLKRPKSFAACPMLPIKLDIALQVSSARTPCAKLMARAGKTYSV
jgi:hypothetical protein